VVKVLEPIWTRIPETAERVRSRIEAVLEGGAADGAARGGNPARWKEGLDRTLDRPKRKKKNFPALPWKQIGVFMEHLRSLGGGASAVEFLILTGARSGLVHQATWTEINFEERVWHVPGPHMKGKEPFDIPLSDAALAVLWVHAAGRANPAGLIFPGARRGRPLSDMTLSMAVRRMSVMPDGTLRYQDPKYGRPPVPHGFRTTLRDWCNDATAFPRGIAEMALAHTVRDETEAAYLRGTAFEIRRLLMDAWGKFCGRGKRPWSVEELRLRPGLDLPGASIEMFGPASIEMLGPALQPLLAKLMREALRDGLQGSSEAE
jgi:integrase